jgi:hypothetical protein
MNQMTVIKCVECKTEIFQNHPNRKFCLECLKNKKRIIQKNRVRRQDKSIEKICVVCKKSFKGYKSLTCSHSCNNIHRTVIKRTVKNFESIRNNLFKSWVMWGTK